MADTESSSSEKSSFNLSSYKETAVTLLTFIAPPAAIAVRQGKVDLESRHLAVSLALYLSVICYLPAVAHAYWLLYVRDNGGIEEWSRVKLGQAEGIWNEHGGVAKTKVDEIAPKVRERIDRVKTSVTDKVKYATDKKDEAISYVTDTRAAVRDFVDDAKNAYSEGTVIPFTKEKINATAQKVKAVLESYPRGKALVGYVEPYVIMVSDIVGKIVDTIFGSKQAAAAVAASGAEVNKGSMGESSQPADVLSDDQGFDSTVDSMTSSRHTEDMNGATEDEGRPAPKSPPSSAHKKQNAESKIPTKGKANNAGKKSNRH